MQTNLCDLGAMEKLQYLFFISFEFAIKFITKRERANWYRNFTMLEFGAYFSKSLSIVANKLMETYWKIKPISF